jgi:hypothetical protein
LACLHRHDHIVRFLLAPPPAGMGATPPEALVRALYAAAVEGGNHAVAQALRMFVDNSWCAARAV